jgi:hypothetical protein
MAAVRSEKDGAPEENTIKSQPSVAQGDVEATEGRDEKVLDETARYLANAAEEYGPMTPEMEKRIVKKIDSWIIPLVSQPQQVPISIAQILALPWFR